MNALIVPDTKSTTATAVSHLCAGGGVTAATAPSVATAATAGNREAAIGKVKPAAAFTLRLRIRGRIMLLTWRPRARMASLLRSLVTRSLRALPATALLLMGVPALALAGGVAPAALPTGAVLAAGQASVSQSGNRMTVTQGSDRAILNWNTFNIGSGATVNFQQPNATSAILNRVMSNDPSALLGNLTANGRVWLINPAGIMVGQGAKIDVAGFVGSTLTIRDEDFLGNRLRFSGGAGAGRVQNFGTITTPEGGNVYLVGAGVENHGVITAPGGEVLLAAGQTVELVDTGTPGVSIAITGADGKDGGSVTNLGRILSEAGRIGVGGALVANSGTLNASSIVRDGGRIFLRSTQATTTGAESTIAADGVNGGSVVVTSDQSAHIDGRISATASTGRGGFVETSARKSLFVAHAPVIGRHGTWLIDPNDVSIENVDVATAAMMTTDDKVVITTASINDSLSHDTNVQITTGTTPGSNQPGDIVVKDAIAMTGGSSATLTLSAHHDVIVQAPITATGGVLGVYLNANAFGPADGAVKVRSQIDLNSGALNVSGPLQLDRARLSNLTLGVDDSVSFVGQGLSVMDVDATLDRVNIVGYSAGVEGSGKLTIGNLNTNGGTIRGRDSDPAYEITNFTMAPDSTFVLDLRPLILRPDGYTDLTHAQLGMINGATIYNQGTLTLRNGSAITSLTEGVSSDYMNRFNIVNNDGVIYGTNTDPVNNVNGIGAIRGEARNFVFNNHTSVTVSDGTLVIGGAGQQSGAFNIQSNQAGKTTTLQFGADYDFSYQYDAQTFGAGTRISTNASYGGSANLQFGGSNSAPYAFNASIDTDLSLANLIIASGAVRGAGKVTVTDLTLRSGAIDGGGSGPAYEVTHLHMPAGSDALLSGRTLNLAEGGTSAIDQATLRLESGAALVNRGTLTLSGGSAIGATQNVPGYNTIDNFGTIEVVRGSGESYQHPVNVLGAITADGTGTTFNNLNAVHLRDSSLSVSGNGSHTGTFYLDAVRNADANSSSNNSSLIFDGLHGASLAGVVLQPGSGIIENRQIGTPKVTIAGTATIDTDLNLTALYMQDGTIQGSGKIIARNLTIDHSGIIRGNGGDPDVDPSNPSVDVVNFFAFNSGATLDGRTLNLSGTGYSTLATTTVGLANGAVLNNRGNLRLGDGAVITTADNGGYGGRINTLNNFGTIESSNSNPTQTLNSIGNARDATPAFVFNNTGGIVSANSGKLIIGGSGTHTGAFEVHDGGPGTQTILQFGSDYDYSSTPATQTFEAGSRFTETTTYGGNVLVQFGGAPTNYHLNTNAPEFQNYVLNTDVNVSTLAIVSGKVQGPGKLSVTDLTWSGGILAGQGNGTQQADEVQNLNLTGKVMLDGRSLSLLSGGASDVSGAMTMERGAVLNNAGTMLLRSRLLGESTSTSADSSINNTGVINTQGYQTGHFYKGPVVGSAFDDQNHVAFNNAGTVNIGDGGFALSGPGTHTGIFNIGGNGSFGEGLSLDGRDDSPARITQTFARGSEINFVNSSFGFPDARVGINGANLTVNLNTNVTVPSVSITGATLQGSGRLTVTDNFAIGDGAMIKGLPGDPAYSVKSLDLYGLATLDGRTLTIEAGGAQSQLSSSDTALHLVNGAVFNNFGIISMNDGVTIGAADSNARNSVFNNAGTIISGPYQPGTNTIGSSFDANNSVTFNNTGTVEVNAGILNLGAPSHSNGGVVRIASGATLDTSGRDFTNSSAGTVSGTGTLNLGSASFTNNGLVSLGDAAQPGNLRVRGDFAQGATGTLAARLNPHADQNHDLLQVTGKVAFGGTLQATALDGYTPAPGDTISIVIAGGTRTGTFASVIAPSPLRAGYDLAAGEAARLQYASSGADYFSNGGRDFNWANPANWSTGAAPGAADSAFIDTGNYSVQHGSGIDTIAALTVNSGNALTVYGGSISVSGLTTDHGTLTTTGDGILNLNGGLTGSGRLAVNGGSVNLAGPSDIANLQVTGGTYTGSGSLNTANASLSGTGVMQGSGKLTATNFTWGGGRIAGTPGSVAYDVTNLTANGFAFLDGRTLNLNGGTSSLTSGLVLQHGAVLNNAGVLNLGNQGYLGYAYVGEPDGRGLNAIYNTGIINSATTIADQFGNIIGSNVDANNKTSFSNSGTVNVTRGLLQIGGDGSHSGAFNVLPSGPSGASLSFGSSSGGVGIQSINAGTVTESSAGGPAAVIFRNGTTFMNADLNLANVDMQGGVLSGTGKLTATNFNWAGGTLRGNAGSPNNPAYDITNMTVAGGIGAVLDARRLNLLAGGQSAINASALALRRGAVIDNAGSLTLRDGAVLGAADPTNGGSLINNSGTIISTVQAALPSSVRNAIGGSFDASNRVGFTNAGTVDAISGGLTMNAGLAGNGVMNITGADVRITGAASAASLAITSGSLSGTGNLRVSQAFRQDAGDLSFTGGSVDLTQSSGDLQVGAIEAATLRLSAGGAIHQSAGGNGIRSASLTTQSAGGVTLDNAANRIAAFTATNTGGGAATIVTSGAIALGTLSNPGGDVAINAGGAITQTGAINAAALRTASVGGSRLTAANTVGSFAGQNSGSGDIELVNASRPGTLVLTDTDNRAGSITVDNTGAIVVAGNLNAGNGNLTLTAHSPITVDAGLYATGTITLNAIASAAGGDVITINGSLNSSGAGIALDAGTDLTVASTASLAVANGSPMNLTADTGSVTIVDGARLIGAVPTITQKQVATSTPVIPAAVAPAQASPSTPSQTPASVSAAIQPTVALVEESLNAPVAASRTSNMAMGLLAMRSGTLTAAAGQQQTIGGTADSFGGPVSEADDARTATGEAIVRPLPVCN